MQIAKVFSAVSFTRLYFSHIWLGYGPLFSTCCVARLDRKPGILDTGLWYMPHILCSFGGVWHERLLFPRIGYGAACTWPCLYECVLLNWPVLPGYWWIKPCVHCHLKWLQCMFAVKQYQLDLIPFLYTNSLLVTIKHNLNEWCL